MGASNACQAAWPRGAALNVQRPPVLRGARQVQAPSVVPPAAEAPAQDELGRLLARMAAGDQSALKALYERTSSKAYGLALRIVGTAALAEEVVIDTFHQAWREARRYDAARGAPIAWLLMMCRSRALDALRGRDPALAHEDPASLIADADHPRDEDPLELLSAVEAHTTLHRALSELSAPQRQMVALAFFRGMTHEEIAAHAALPLGTVKSQIRRALGVLRRLLGPEAGEAR